MSKASKPKLDLSQVGRTNLYYCDEEIRLIDEAICRTREALQRVREEKRVVILREEALQSELDRYLSARAPIKRLPDNVLCNMFEWHCQVGSPVGIPFSSWSFPPQITISHVCSAWRQIVLNIPAFWCNIRLEPDPEFIMDIEKDGEVAHAWLSRAKLLPCSVDIRFENSNSWPNPVYQDNWHRNIVQDLISRYKVKKLDLTFPGYHLRELLRLPGERLSCIEDLYLHHVDLMDKDALPFELHKLSSLTSFTLSDPFLRAPSLGGIVPEDGSRFASIPWPQLRHIEIHISFLMLFCLRILDLSSVLETCSLCVYVDSLFMSSSSWPFLKEPIHCSQLRELKVDIHSPPVIDTVLRDDDTIVDPFLCSIRCPNLKSLTVGSNKQSTTGLILPRSINLQTLLKMQHVSGMHLAELIIYNTVRDLEVLPLLENFSSLRRLVLPPTINFTEEAMDKLGSGSIAPFLEDLTINKTMLVLEKLFQMIKTRSCVGQEDSKRKYKVTPFKSVILCGKGFARKEYTGTIKEINRSGVSLHVNWRNYDMYGRTHYRFEDYDDDSSDSYE